MVTDVECPIKYATEELPFGRLSVDEETRESWTQALGSFKDASIYQTWEYGATRWGEANLSHVLIRDGSRLVAAAQLRIIKPRYVPIGVAYLRWGPLHRIEENSDSVVKLCQILEALKREYCMKRGLLLQIVPHTFCGTPEGEVLKMGLEGAGFEPLTYMSSYKTIRVDLNAEVGELRKSLDQKWRNQLNRAEKNGLEVVIGHDSSAYDEFALVYQKMWERKRFETSVDVEELAGIQRLLPEALRMRVFLGRHAGQTIAAVVCSAMGDSAIYLLGATDEKARELKAAYVLQWRTMLWLKENRIRWYDLGGIDADANPGGYHFKNGIGGDEHTALSAYGFCKNRLAAKLARVALKVRSLKNFSRIG